MSKIKAGDQVKIVDGKYTYIGTILTVIAGDEEAKGIHIRWHKGFTSWENESDIQEYKP